ncbi:MAG: acetate--CoA ligase family protein, partial [Bacteroidota bacterium]
ALATDYLVSNGGQLANLSNTCIEKLNVFLPQNWSKGNPVDLLGDANGEAYTKAFEVLKQEDGVDGILLILTPQAMTNPTEVAEKITAVAEGFNKPVLAVWMGEAAVMDGREVLEQARIPNFRYPENAVLAFLQMFRYREQQGKLKIHGEKRASNFVVDKIAAQKIIAEVKERSRVQLLEHEAKALLNSYGIPVSHFSIAQNEESAIKQAALIGFPVVMKVISPDIAHKTDFGGVALNLTDEQAVKIAYRQMLAAVKKHHPVAHVEGVLIESMVSKPFELLIGAKQDDIFGPVIAFGQGGISVEVRQDVQFALPPLNIATAKEMISSIRIFPLLEGFRGKAGINLPLLQEVLIRFSQLVEDFPQFSEIDINPFVMDQAGGVALDAHIVLAE